MSSSNGLYAGEIECLASRMLGDTCKYLGSKAAIGEHATRTSVRWLGVFPRDQLPDLERELRPFALVLNTDPHDKPGQHWLALFAPTNSPIELFDSYGLDPSYYKLPSSLIHCSTKFQSISSSFCGHYALYFIYLRAHKYSYDHIVSWLRTMPSPDQWVANYINSLQQRFRTLSPCNHTGQCCLNKCSFC